MPDCGYLEDFLASEQPAISSHHPTPTLSMTPTSTSTKTGTSAPHSASSGQPRGTPRDSDRPSRLDQPRRPRLWPWEWMHDHGAVAHAQGCAVCDAYLNHLDAERELGVQSLTAAEEHRLKDLTLGEYTRGYETGSAQGRADAEIVRGATEAQETSRLRAQVRALENKSAKLAQRLSAFKMAHGITSHYAGEDADPDSDDNFGFEGGEDDDDIDDLQLSAKERRAREAARPTAEQTQRYLRDWFAERGTRWDRHVSDTRRLRLLAREATDQVRPQDDGDVIMRSPTHPSQQPEASAPAVPTGIDVAAPPRSQPRRASRGRSEHRTVSPPRTIPSRRGRSPSRGFSPNPIRRRSLSPPPWGSAFYPGYGQAYNGPPMGPFYQPYGMGPGYPPPGGMAQGGRNGPTPAYADHAYGYAPHNHYDQTQALVDHYAPGIRTNTRPPSPRRRSPTRAPSPDHHRSSSEHRRASPSANAGHSRSERAPLRGSEVPPPYYDKYDAPPVPRTREELRRVIETAQNDTVAGAHAVARLRYWSNGLHKRTLSTSPEVEREFKAYRLPLWYKEAFEPSKIKGDKGKGRAGSPMEKEAQGKGKGRAASPPVREPRADEDVEAWLRYAEAHPSLLPRHVERDDEGRIAADTVAGYVLANRFSSIGNAVPYNQRKRQRLALFRFLAEALVSSQHYAAELQRVGATPADSLMIVPYTGPFPPTLDNVIHHAARSGIAITSIEPALAAWATHYLSSASTRGDAAQPADTQTLAQAEAPPAPTEGSGAPTLGGDATADAMDIAEAIDPPAANDPSTLR